MAAESMREMAPFPSHEEFEAALASLVIVCPRGGETFIGPIREGDASERVAAWLEDLLEATPALVAYIGQRLAATPEVLPGLKVLAVASLREALGKAVKFGARRAAA
jgi:hypothetical protein